MENLMGSDSGKDLSEDDGVIGDTKNVDEKDGDASDDDEDGGSKRQSRNSKKS
jgi:hypothetical protein